ncbi:MAG TPA: pyrroline-5-carboxylate reductase [Lacipirellulaceae bacterium]|nr:pyrroline-5-carboxylate reductase [Lacipirellulaceae bacterium]
MLTTKIGLIGAGRMATALARGFVRAQMVRPEAILASDPSEAARDSFADQVPGARVVAENRPVASQADVVFLAVKPQMMKAALGEIRDALRPASLMVSIAAGVTLKRLAAGLPAGQRIIRVMPNTPCLIGEGTSAYSLGESATADDSRLVSELLSAVGVAREVPEAMLDAVTGLSGSGPAFVYSMIEALADGGGAAGLPAELASEMAARTVAGAAQMVIQTGETPSVLRDRVTSPGGTTLAGLAVLQERGFNDAVSAAVVAAAKRSRELGQSSG